MDKKKLEFRLNNNQPISSQIRETFIKALLNNVYRAGDKIKSIRELSILAGVSPNTIAKSLTELEREGLLISNRTQTKSITSDKTKIESFKKEVIDKVVSEFLETMYNYGFSKEETIREIKKHSNSDSKSVRKIAKNMKGEK